MTGSFGDIDIHAAYIGTFSAGDARIFVYLHVQQ